MIFTPKRYTLSTYIVRGAVDHMLAGSKIHDRLTLMRQAKRIWAARKDLPDFAKLRGEFDRLPK